MIEELTIIKELVGDLTGVALYVVLGFFFAYLMYISILAYAIVHPLKLLIIKLHDWAVNKIPPAINKTEKIHLDGKEISTQDFSSMCITTDNTHEALMKQIRRLRKGARTSGYSSSYIHGSDVEWLADAIDAKESLEKEDAD